MKNGKQRKHTISKATWADQALHRVKRHRYEHRRLAHAQMMAQQPDTKHIRASLNKMQMQPKAMYKPKNKPAPIAKYLPCE